MASERVKRPANLKVMINKGDIVSRRWQVLFWNNAADAEAKYEWKYVQLNIQIRNLFMPEWKDTFFAFVSTRGDSYASDIAIDDVQMRPVRCQEMQ